MTPEERDALLKLWRRWPECRPERMRVQRFHTGMLTVNPGEPSTFEQTPDAIMFELDRRSDYQWPNESLDDSEAADLACAAIERAIFGLSGFFEYSQWTGLGHLCRCGIAVDGKGVNFAPLKTKLETLIFAANALLDQEAGL